MDEELGASTLVPDGSFHARESVFTRRYREENEGTPNTVSASDELRISSVEGRKNLYHRNAISHLATHFWPSELYMPARLGSEARTDWSPYPTFGRFTLFFPEFLINQVTIWESGHVRRDAAGAVLSWLNTYADRLLTLDLQYQTAESQNSLGRLLGV